jgi:hypothetical protein
VHLNRQLAKAREERDEAKLFIAERIEGVRAIEDRCERLIAERDDALHKLSRCMHALALIASPRRPDGTYNRDREACERLARETLEATK